MPPVVTLTPSGMIRGATLSLPFCVSSIIYGLAFGLLSTDTGLSAVQSIAMSALVFSGTAQVVVLQTWATHPALLTVLVSVVVANIRYVLMGAALRSWLAPLGTLKAILILMPLVDGSFALAFRERSKGDHDAGVLLGSSLISYTGWVVGTALGTAAGQLIANPRAIGLDFIVVAFCAASAAMLLRARADIVHALAATAAVIACEQLALGPWTVIAAGVAAAVVAALRYQPPYRDAAGEAAP